MTQSKRIRKPQTTLQHDMHPLLKEIATRQRDKLEVVVDELLIAGLKAKRQLPVGFREQSTSASADRK
jgi:hypothetical protein